MRLAWLRRPFVDVKGAPYDLDEMCGDCPHPHDRHVAVAMGDVGVYQCLDCSCQCEMSANLIRRAAGRSEQ